MELLALLGWLAGHVLNSLCYDEELVTTLQPLEPELLDHLRVEFGR